MVKVDRSQPAPASLIAEAAKSDGKYDLPDVVERLVSDFSGKCYICELKPLQDPVIEHLLPHKNDKYHDRKFDWNNLFYSCGHCNSVKNQTKYDVGIIDCCNVDPERELQFRFENDDVHVTAFNNEDSAAKLTAELVYEVFNKKNTGMRVQKCAVRMDALRMEMNMLFDCIEEFKESHGAFVKRKLQYLLDRRSAFAAFKRCYVRSTIHNYPELAEFVRI